MAAQATATGTLGATPLANLLVYVLDRRLTGTLVIEDDHHRKSAVLFADGAPAKVKLPEPVALLSGILVELGAIDAALAESTFEEARSTERLHGSVLVEGGHVDAPTLSDALSEQIRRKLEWLCSLGASSVYGYYDGQDFLQSYGGQERVASEPLEAIWRIVQAQANPEAVAATLARLGDREVRLHPRSRVGRFAFDARDRGALDVLRAKPQPLPTLIATGLLPEERLKRVLFTLIITRHLDLGGGTEPVGVQQAPVQNEPARGPARAPEQSSPPAAAGSKRPSPMGSEPGVAGPALSESAEAFRTEIRERTASIGSQNYYQILGVDQAAPTPAIQAAFFQLAKKWHPDRIAPELADERDAAVRIFARMSEAHQMLTNDEQRREYERLMKEGGSTADEQEVVQRVLRAAGAFQKAEVLARRGNLAEALKQAQLAMESDPEQAEYSALYADLASQDPERQQSGSFGDLLKLVGEARKRQPQNMRVRLYRARVLKRSGDALGAYREYRNIVEEDANNVEAAREVRLHEMRHGKNTTDPRKASSQGSGGARGKEPAASAGGLLGKLFKR